VFGLVNRDEYQLSASSDLFDTVLNYLLVKQSTAKVITSPGCNRLGISLSLRKNHQSEIIELIKTVTTVKETVPA